MDLSGLLFHLFEVAMLIVGVLVGRCLRSPDRGEA